MDDEILINEHLAYKSAQGIADPITRNLVMLGIAKARMRAIRRVGQHESEWRGSLPQQPFDMAFLAAVLASMFDDLGMVRAVLDGKDLAQASGWDV